MHLGQVLAPEEWDPTLGNQADPGAAEFVDPESAVRGRVGADARRGLELYEQSLDAFIARWSDLAAAHGISHRAWSSADAFERFLPDLLR